MFDITKKENLLQVEFSDGFDYECIRKVIHQVTSHEAYPDTNDIWLIEDHQSDIRLHELEKMVFEFMGRCPEDATRTKTAIVAAHGPTRATITLWLKAARRRVNFDIQLFLTKEEAIIWLKKTVAQVA